MLMNRRLVRSRTDTILGGVAAGLANYLNADPALVRIAWAILVPLTSGAALIAYIVAWIVVPEAPRPRREASVEGAEDAAADGAEPVEEPEPEPAAGANGRAGIVVGVGLIVLGAWFFAREYLPAINWGLIWPLILVGIGALILVNAARRRD
jgi:phage shock protein C